MTTTPKGFTQITNAQAPNGPDQINSAELFVENLLGEHVATSASLPPAADWPNRFVQTDNDGALWRSNGSAWHRIYEDILDATSPSLSAIHSGWTVSASARRVGRLGQLFVSCKPAANTPGGGNTNNIALCTVPAGWRPSLSVLGSNPDFQAGFTFDTAGVVTLNSIFASQWPANVQVGVNFTYILA